MKSDTTLYQGKRWTDDSGRQQRLVLVDGRDLDPAPSQKLLDNSFSPLDWGYKGSAPAQLALAMLFDFTGDAAVALTHYQHLKTVLVSGLGDSWSVFGFHLRLWLETALLPHAEVTWGPGRIPPALSIDLAVHLARDGCLEPEALAQRIWLIDSRREFTRWQTRRQPAAARYAGYEQAAP